MYNDKKVSLLNRKLAAASTEHANNLLKPTLPTTFRHRYEVPVPDEHHLASSQYQRAVNHNYRSMVYPNEYPNNIANRDISSFPVTDDRLGSSEYFQYREQPEGYEQPYMPQEVFHESSDFVDPQYYINATAYQTSIQNETGDFQGNGYSNEEFNQHKGYSVPQNSNIKQMKNLRSGNAKDLLRNLCQEDNTSLFSKIGATKSRDNSLYRKLHLLMGHKAAPELSSTRGGLKNLKNLEAPMETDAKSSESKSAVVIPQFAGNSQVSEASVPKPKTLYSSLAKIQQKLSSKENLEKLIEKGDRKRTKRFWTTQRDAQLRNFIKMYGQDWEAIASAFNDPELTAEIIKERYDNRISPQISKARFSLQEDQTIAHYYSKLGANWKKITAYLPGRTETMVRNRFYTSIKKKDLGKFLNQTSAGDLHNVSANSSDNKVMTQPSGENSSLCDDLSENLTGKHSEPEIGSGSTAASLHIAKNPANIKKKVANALNMQNPVQNRKADSLSNKNFTYEPSNLLAQTKTSQFEMEAEARNRANFEFPTMSQNLQESQANFPSKNSFMYSPALGSMKENKDYEFWEPFDFANGLEMSRREPPELIGFDNISSINQKADAFLDPEVNPPGLNAFSQDNFCETLLNFKDDNNFIREHPLTPIDQGPMLNLSKPKKLTVSALEEEFNSLFGRTGLALPSGRAEQLPTNQQDLIMRSNAPPSAKLSQLDSLMSQIRSIEKLFDRTKQEINLFQNRFVAK